VSATHAGSLRRGQAFALGLLHGPAERWPVSSSAHTTLVPWLLGWPYDELDAAARKRFEVALHAGAVAAALALERRGRPRRRATLVSLACAPPALAGALLERPVERYLGTPATIAAGLAGGALAMALAERRRGARRGADAGARDALALGAAQALALFPGVSRSGAARAAARWRGFAPRDAAALAEEVGLPITVAAVALKGREALRCDAQERRVLAAGAAAAFASTALCGAAARRRAGAGSLLPFAAYRLALAGAVVGRLRQNARR
jgi:undecaprenyl-diphosphatase